MKLICIIVAGLLTLTVGGAAGIEPVGWGSNKKLATGNDSFETVKDNKAALWGSNTGVQPMGTVAVEHGDTVDGNNYLRFKNNAGQLHHFYTEKSFPVNGGETITFSIYARGQGAFKLGLYAYGANNMMLAILEPKAAVVNSPNWIKKEFMIPVPAKDFAGKGRITRVNVAIIVEQNSNIQLDNLSGVIKADRRTVPAAVINLGNNSDPKPGAPGKAPYEMAGRKEVRKPFMTFEDCTKWATECHNAVAALYRSEEQRMPFRQWCGKLVYRATGPDPSVIVRPEKLIEIPEPWDCVNVWNWGNVWCWAPAPDNPALEMAVLVRGADGQEHEIKLGITYYKYWFLSHAKLTEKIARPAVFCGLRFTNCNNPVDRSIYLDSVYFYKEELKPLNFAESKAKLPFPTRKETILPSNKTADFKNAGSLNGAVATFSYQGADTKLEYQLDLTKRFLDGLKVFSKEQSKPFYISKGAEVILENGQPAVMTLLDKGMKGNDLHLRWQCAAGKVKTILTADIRIQQKSLVITFDELAKAGKIAELTLGRAENLDKPELIWIPYLSYYWNKTDPHLLRNGKLFAFSHFDWYVSDASRLTGARDQGVDWAKFNGSADYVPKTDGKRNPLHERLFITVSPDVQEVFPTIPNPPSPLREQMARRQWRVKGGMPHASEIAEAEHIRALGIKEVAIRYHEGIWRDGGESYTFRLHAAPESGGDEGLKNMISKVQALGWLAGTYTNYTDLAPVNSFWDEQWTMRQPDGNWVSGWARCYVPKPAFGRKMEAELAPQVQAKFGERHSYCDVLSAVPPFHWVDYDHRAPDAGKFRSTFENFGQIMMNERIAHKGPAFSEGGCHWWYAGLLDGNYGQLFPHSGNPPEQPLFPDFDLLKIHPLEMDAGMGEQNMFYRSSPQRNYRQFIATTLAYGHLGFLKGTDAEMMKMYYMLQPLQEYYVMVPVRSISYECNGRMLDSSAALVDGGWRDSRLHVVYRNGFSVWVNGSATDWTVQTGVTGTWTLQPWGYVARSQDGRVYAVSARTAAVSGNNLLEKNLIMDISQGPESHYLDLVNGFVYAENLAGDGAAALKKEDSGWELIPAGKFSEFGFADKLVGGSGKVLEIVPVDAAGKVWAPQETRRSRGMTWIISGKQQNVFKYQIKVKDNAVPETISSRTLIAAGGQTVELTATEPISSACWVGVDGREIPAKMSREGNKVRCEVPSDIKDGSHIWLKAVIGKRVEWLDFVAVKAFSLGLNMNADEIKHTGAKEVTLTLSNRLEQPLKINLNAVTAGQVNGLPATLEVGGMSSKVLSLKWQPGADKSLKINSEALGVKQAAGIKIDSVKTQLATGNDSFEDIAYGKAAKWGSNTGYQPLGLLTVKTGDAVDGQKFLEFINNAGQLHHLYSEQGYNVTGGDKVRLSIYARGKGTFHLALYAYNSSSRWLDCLEPKPVKVDNQVWEKYDFSITVPDKEYASNDKVKRINIAIIVDFDSKVQLDGFSGFIESPPAVVRY